jgi:hypothetical protein
VRDGRHDEKKQEERSRVVQSSKSASAMRAMGSYLPPLILEIDLVVNRS